MTSAPGHNVMESTGFEACDGGAHSCPGGELGASSFNLNLSAHKNSFRELVHIQRPRVCHGAGHLDAKQISSIVILR